MITKTYASLHVLFQHPHPAPCLLLLSGPPSETRTSSHREVRHASPQPSDGDLWQAYIWNELGTLTRTLLHAWGIRQTSLNIMLIMHAHTRPLSDLGNKDCDEIRACIKGGWQKGVTGHLARPLPPAWSPFALVHRPSHLGCSDSATHCYEGLEGEEKEGKGFRGSGMGYG